ncbi:hypothetical protein ACFS6H_00235 [Terrimonas rubra]|uniref:Reverse transcriptase (RNA-dependent DNA polymerase) n=1 Tax=Terrimonas rubra TaxID=1035890 RepID=A0ABW6A079_9BACT
MTKSVTQEEVKIAFSKLQANVYFDNYDLILRQRVAIYKKRLNSNITSFIAESRSNNAFGSVLGKMDFSILPKKVKPRHLNFHSNYYTNKISSAKTEIARPNVHCDFPIELHLIATIWLMRYGAYLEGLVPATSFGNRLAIDQSTNKTEGRSLFKPYFKQFQNWWSLAIKATKNALNKEQSVTILNFDLKYFYHEVRFDFDKLESTLLKKFPEIENDVIHIVLKKIHIKYRGLLKVVKPNLSIEEDNIVPLPIGLFTSHVLANFHLRSLDRYINREFTPLYYGRYVDDVLIVLKNTVLDEQLINNEAPKQGNKDEIIKEYLKTQFPNLFSVPEDSQPITFKIASLKNLRLNMDKLFIYQFDHDHSPNLIEKFVEEQKERSSMFRFLSDEEDESFDDFESQTFESNFDNVDLNKARFKNLEDNKYKLSTFLSKLIKRRIQRGALYKEAEIDKIGKFFKGGYLIEHYFFWEKLFTLLVVYKRMDELSDLAKEILDEIESIQISESNNEQDFNITADDYKISLRLHFENALAMSIGLDLNMLRKNPSLVRTLKTILPSIEKKKAENSYHSTADYLEVKYTVFRDTGLLRGGFVYYPLFQFTKFAFDYNVDLTSPESIFGILKTEEDITKSFGIRRIDFIPFRIKFWQAAILTYYKNLLECENQTDKKWFTDKFSSHELLNTAFDLFYEINKPSVPKELLKDEYFQTLKTDIQEDAKLVIPEKREHNYYIQEIYTPNGGQSQDTYRVALINKYVDAKEYLSSLNGNPVVDSEKMEIFDRILDEVSGIKKCDLFVMPELSLPHRLIARYTDQVARNQIAYITGIEHLKIRNIGFNFLFTVLPINIAGDKDAIPVLRLKNHYAPIEEDCIWDEKERGEKMAVPKPRPYRYDLFEWRGFYFSSYYCYELADVFHRSIFFSQVDAIIAPVWNADTHYYNSIIDAATRDMHNYFIIVNTAQYGFSKIARPQDHVNKEKVIVKGGTERDYNFTILVGDLKIKDLRNFQKLTHDQQREGKKEAKRTGVYPPELKFKATPPDFPPENVETRENNDRFYIDYI